MLFLIAEEARQRAFLGNSVYVDLRSMFYMDFMNTITNRLTINQSTINRFRDQNGNNDLLSYSHIFDIRFDVSASYHLAGQQYANTYRWDELTGNDSVLPARNSISNICDVTESTVSQYDFILERLNEAADRHARRTSTPILSDEERVT